MLKKGRLVEFIAGNSQVYGFIIGTCSYDNCGKDNAYVIRYVIGENQDTPRKPYTIVAADKVKPHDKIIKNFNIGDHWGGTPEDRCDNWEMVETDIGVYVVPHQK